MNQTTVIRRGTRKRSRTQKFFLFVGGALILLAVFAASQLLSPAVQTWKSTDFANMTRQDMFAQFPGALEVEAWEGTDIWVDEGWLFDRSLLVFRGENVPDQTFMYDNVEYAEYSVADAIVSYHVTLPFAGYVEYYYDWIYFGED